MLQYVLDICILPELGSGNLEKSIQSLAGRKAQLLDDEKAIKSSVILPLVEDAGKGLSVLFEIRSQDLKGQPGEICFPGGHMEEDDENPQETALRETSEELGVDRSNIEVICPLDILVSPFQLVIYPFLGRIKEGTVFQPFAAEVEEIFTVPLEYLLKAKPLISKTSISVSPPPDFPYHLIDKGENYNWREGCYPVYFYFYENHIIWGLTARILHNFLGLISQKI